ncbi:hypothetical protein SAMN04487995_0907 [Dyadobacter koreensis]|uniref:CARDB protein n=1 Tax=Dyadobacter koreensis TaxID=408657 RepID=A0A1H6QQU9_9BACT|nr:hypothetical protein [Dyadobacter koreensis]SEI45979.1 hypothetical protein SAMN04487995_0907 [Dyadobacter koreensis]
MKLVWFTYLLVVCLLNVCSANGKQAGNFLYDMGTVSSRVESGYLGVNPDLIFSKERGYGWINGPKYAFDTLYNRIADTLFCDGVVGEKTLIFKTNIPQGEYFLLITIGHPGQDVMQAKIGINGQVVTENISAPWFRLPYRSVRRKITVGKNGAVVEIKSIGKIDIVGLYRIEFRSVADIEEGSYCKIPETEAGEMTASEGALKVQILKDPANTALQNRLNVLQKHLTAERYYELAGWSFAVTRTKMNQIQRMYAAIDLLDQIVADPADPLYYKSLYLLAKIHYWLAKEDSELLPGSKSQVYFDQLAKVFPNHRLIRMYKGEKIEDPFKTGSDMSGAPKWAVLQQEAMARMLKVIHWWVQHRQSENGELGGKYADDVEMLRWWLPAILGADDSLARVGYTRLADGIWNSGALVRGYDKKTDDVEHSAELFRDSHTGMFMVRYADPAYVERAMISMQNFGEVWSGITKAGHRHFKSYYLSATETLNEKPYGVDVPLNARALLPGLWAAWYNKNPLLIKQFSEWAQAWVEDASREENGKPAGMIPPAVSFEQEKIGGYSDKWYEPGLRYNYYNWDHLGHISELYSFLSGLHAITGNDSFLNPINKVADLTKASVSLNPTEKYKPGSPDWVKSTLISGGEDKTAGANPFGNIFAMTAKLTGQTRYDDLIRQHASPYNRYQLTGNQNEMLSGFDVILNSLRYNFPLMTSEVKFTDRVYVRGSDLLTGMYTGHFGRGFEFPALVATWKNTGPDVSVFVRNGGKTSALVSLCNAGDQKQVEMNTWMLTPGVYKVNVGLDKNDDTVAEKQIEEKLVTINERVGVIKIALPARAQVVVRVSRISEIKQKAESLPDLALSRNDVVISESGDQSGMLKIHCALHNIGNAPSAPAMAYLNTNGAVSDSTAVDVIEAPNDLHPRVKTIHFNWKPKPGKHQISVLVKYDGPEVNSQNNSVTIGYSYPDIKKTIK